MKSKVSHIGLVAVSKVIYYNGQQNLHGYRETFFQTRKGLWEYVSLLHRTKQSVIVKLSGSICEFEFHLWDDKMKQVESHVN